MSDVTASSPSASRARLLESRRRESRRDLACARTAHSVRDGEERRPPDEHVLVPHAPAPGVGDARAAPDPHACTCSSVSPIRMTSPAFASCALLQLRAVDERAVRRAEIVDPCSVRAAARCVRAATTRTRRARGGCRSSRRDRRRSARRPRSSVPCPSSELARTRSRVGGRPCSARSALASAAPRTMLSCGACVIPLVAERTTKRMKT